MILFPEFHEWGFNIKLFISYYWILGKVSIRKFSVDVLLSQSLAIFYSFAFFGKFCSLNMPLGETWRFFAGPLPGRGLPQKSSNGNTNMYLLPVVQQ